MKKLMIFFALLLTVENIFALEYKGEGRFYSQKEDSQAFVKQQLLYLAFRDVMTQQLEKMGLNSSVFWEKYEEKFDKSFSYVEEDLKKKYGIDENGKGKSQKLLKFKEELRSKKLRLKRRFGRIERTIQQYSIDKISRSPKVPNARYIRVKAKVNKNRLHEIYLKFTTQDSGRTFRNIFLSFRFNLDGANWSDLGVEAEKDFTSVVSDYWRKWFEENTKTFIENVHLASFEKENEIEGHLKRLSHDLSTGIALNLSRTEKNKEGNQEGVVTDETEEEEDIEVSDLSEDINELSRSLWLKLTINIKKKHENEIAKQREFEVSGDYLLIELDTNSFVSHQDFERESKSYSYEDLQKLSSLTASFIYGLPLKNFALLQKKMASMRGSSNKIDLNIENANSIFTIMQLKDFLADRGMRLQLKPTFKSYDGMMGVLMLNFQGQKEKVSDFLTGLDGEGIAPGFVMRVNKESPLNVRIEKGMTEGVFTPSTTESEKTATQQGHM